MKNINITFPYSFDVDRFLEKLNERLVEHGLRVVRYNPREPKVEEYDDSLVYFEGERARDVRLDRTCVPG